MNIFSNKMVLDEPILGGQIVSPAQYPFFTTIYEKGTFTCSGVLVSPHLILTAAHCIEYNNPQDYTVMVSDGRNLRQPVRAVVSHPCYQSQKKDFFADVALLWVDEVNNQEGTFIAISKQSNIPTGETVIALGSGATASSSQSIVPLEVELPVQDNSKCQAIFEIPNQGWQICAGGDGNRDVCRGDSGGPLILKSTKELVGVTSYGAGKCLEGTPSAFTKLSYFQSFLDIGLSTTLPSSSPTSDYNNQLNNAFTALNQSIKAIDCQNVRNGGNGNKPSSKGSISTPVPSILSYVRLLFYLALAVTFL